MSTTASQPNAKRNGTIAAIWRYPVKSLRGESLTNAEVERRGLVGDRRLAVRDAAGKLGSGKTSRRFRALPRLFDFRASTDDGTIWVEGPGIDGRLPAGSDELDSLLGRRYGELLRVTAEADVSHFDQSPIHLMTTASQRWLVNRLGEFAADARRFRPNLVLDLPGDDLPEDRWLGHRLRAGGAELLVVDRTVRCVMPTLPQEELERDPAILRRLAADNDTCLGVYAEVLAPGVVRVGDRVALE